MLTDEEIQKNLEDKAGDKADAGAGPGTFTSEQQAAIDKLVGQTRVQNRETVTKEFLAALGVDSIEAAKESIAAAAKLKREQLTELEAAQADVETHKAAAATAKSDADLVVAKANLRLKRSAVLIEAAKPEYKINADALSDIWGFVQTECLDSLSIDDDDNVVGVDAALKAVLAKRAYLTAEELPRYGTPQGKTRKVEDKTTQKDARRTPSIRF